MTHLPYKLLLLDLDGTTLGQDEQLSPRVAKSIKKIRTLVDISIATGREKADVEFFAKKLGLQAPQICDNGAVMFDPITGDAILSNPIGINLCKLLLFRLRKLSINILCTYPEGQARLPLQHAGEITRISALSVEETQADKLIDCFSDLVGIKTVKVFLPHNETWAVDFTGAGVDKGSAAVSLAAISGVCRSQIIAVGDSYNDVPMFRVCGLRIAMGGSPESLKILADHVVPSVSEDGLAVAIDQVLLPLLVSQI